MEIPYCRSENSCTPVAEGAACGTVPEHFPNLPTAEQLCPSALANQIAFETNDYGELRPARRLVRLAWANVETALGLPGDASSAADLFDDARILIDRAVDASTGAHIEDGRQDMDAFFGATLLDIYLPAFQGRQAGRLLSTKYHMAIRGGLFNLMDRIDESRHHSEVKTGFHNKISLQLALLRSSFDFYPASAREGRSRVPEYVANNHDGYVLYDDIKVPIKVRGSGRREKEYRGGVLFLPYRPMIMDAYRRSGGDRKHISGQHADEMVRLLRLEAEGEWLDIQEHEWLRLAGEGLTERVKNYAEVLASRSSENDSPSDDPTDPI